MKMQQEKRELSLGGILNRVFVKGPEEEIGLEVLQLQLAASGGGEALGNCGFACTQTTLTHYQHIFVNSSQSETTDRISGLSWATERSLAGLGRGPLRRR